MIKTKRLSGPGEWLAAAGVVLNVIPIFTKSLSIRGMPPTLETILSQIGIVSFLAGVVVSITAIRRRSEEAEKELAQITALTLGIDQMSNVALNFGTALSMVLQLLTDNERQNPDRLLHIRAGEKMLRNHIVGFVPSFARDLMDLRTNRTTLELKEPYFINDLLGNLKDALGSLQGSVWLGVTHLSQGWLQEKADPGYYEFAEGMRRLSSQRDLHVFRIYCFESEPDDPQIIEHLREECAAGVRVRILTCGKRCPEDLSLIWPPPSTAVSIDRLIRAPKPIGVLRSANLDPICGLRFTTRQGRSLDQVEICSPDSDEFESLEQQFSEAWSDAIPFLPGQAGSQ